MSRKINGISYSNNLYSRLNLIYFRILPYLYILSTLSILTGYNIIKCVTQIDVDGKKRCKLLLRMNYNRHTKWTQIRFKHFFWPSVAILTIFWAFGSERLARIDFQRTWNFGSQTSKVARIFYYTLYFKDSMITRLWVWNYMIPHWKSVSTWLKNEKENWRKSVIFYLECLYGRTG